MIRWQRFANSAFAFFECPKCGEAIHFQASSSEMNSWSEPVSTIFVCGACCVGVRVTLTEDGVEVGDLIDPNDPAPAWLL